MKACVQWTKYIKQHFNDTYTTHPLQSTDTHEIALGVKNNNHIKLKRNQKKTIRIASYGSELQYDRDLLHAADSLWIIPGFPYVTW